MRLLIIFWGCYLFAFPVFAWNAEGHRVVAHIALDYMTPGAKARFQVAHTLLLDKPNELISFTEAAVWFDTVRGRRFPGIDSMHYVDIPILSSSEVQFDGSADHQLLHALMAYTGSRQILLLGNTSVLEQMIALRILLHVTADLHQPLHAATRLTRKNPKGDAGGNKVRLPKNKVSRNLHTYWDRAGGFLTNRMPVSLRAHVLEKMWPCDLNTVDTDPIDWLAESHVIAEKKAYQLIEGVHAKKYLDDAYQMMVQAVSQKRLAEAGCRLAAVLNEIDAYGFPMIV